MPPANLPKPAASTPVQHRGSSKHPNRRARTEQSNWANVRIRMNLFARARGEHLWRIIHWRAVMQLVVIRDEKQSNQANKRDGKQRNGKARLQSFRFAGSRDHLW